MLAPKRVTPIADPNATARLWYHLDLENKVLGRASTEIARILRGKHKTTFSPHQDCGDYVLVTNAEKVRLTGHKWTDKIYYRVTGYMGHLKSFTAKEALKKHPEYLVYAAVRGMLPKNRLGRKLIKKLRVFPSQEHPYKTKELKPLLIP